MKKRTVISILLVFLSLLILTVLALYLTFSNSDSLFETGESRIESEAEAALQALNSLESETESEIFSPETASADLPEIPLIWVGDSRTVGMENAIDNDNIFIAASGEGYYWFRDTGLPLLKEAIRENPGTPVIFNLGVNDHDNLENYLSLYTDLAAQYPGVTFYYLSVNPIEPTMCSNITNEEIQNFNHYLKTSFPDTFLDSFTFLMINEIIPFDGVHYSEEDYRLIYEFTVKEISEGEKEQ